MNTMMKTLLSLLFVSHAVWAQAGLFGSGSLDSDLFEAARHGDVQQVKTLLQALVDAGTDLERTVRGEETPLIAAAAVGIAGIVSCFLAASKSSDHSRRSKCEAGAVITLRMKPGARRCRLIQLNA